MQATFPTVTRAARWTSAWRLGLKIGVLGVLCSGCVRAPPSTPVAGIPTPPAWMAGAEVGGDLLEPWWTLFGDPDMTRAVQEAVQANLDLRQFLARLDAAAAQARIAGAPLAPGVDLGAGWQRQQQVFVGLPIPGREGEPLTSRATVHGVSLNLSWEVDLWGRMRAGQQAALADVQATEQEYRAGLASVAGQTVRLWLAAAEASRQRELARATAESFGVTVRQVRERYERGLRSALDLRLSLQNEAVARAQVNLREQELEGLIRQLEILLGRYPAGALAISPTLPELPGVLPAGLPSALLERRPDLAAAERRLAASLARVEEAKAALFPRISLTASGGRTSDELADLLSSDFNVWSLAANVAQPVLQGGRLQAGVSLNEARAREAVEQYRLAVLRAFGEVETALASEGWLERREADLLEAVEQSRAALRLAEDRYRTGLIDFVTLMETQRIAFNTQSEFIRVRRQRLENRVDLALALGGGFGMDAVPRMTRVWVGDGRDLGGMPRDAVTPGTVEDQGEDKN
jgi:outer membrane protein, multidrug efflux system